MKIAIISFTELGSKLNVETISYLNSQQHEAQGYTLKKYIQTGLKELHIPLQEWTKEMFHTMDAILFISATGIAVRSIAPYIKSKTTDPAVLVMDEAGNYVISLLSGHLGGANEICENIAKQFHAMPIITTATDIHHVFAVDMFAKHNTLTIDDMKLAKEISASLLHDIPVSIACDLAYTTPLPKGLTQQQTKLGIYIGVYKKQPYYKTLVLIPKLLFVGMGCKKGTSKEKLQAFLHEIFNLYELQTHAIHSIASIDLKKDEQGLCELAYDLKVPFITYNAEELQQVQGEFQSSSFVKSVTKVDNVCERSAVKASNGILIVKKHAKDGMTIAIAMQEGSVHFE